MSSGNNLSSHRRQSIASSTCSNYDDDNVPCRTPRTSILALRVSFILLMIAIIIVVISCVVPRQVDLDAHRMTAREYEAAESYYAHRAVFMDVLLVVGLGVLCLACIALSTAHVAAHIRDVYRDRGRIGAENQSLTTISPMTGYGGFIGVVPQ